MKFLIISPVYNGESWIEKCINTVRHQSFSNFKHIIVDDGSDDKTCEIVEKVTKNDSRYILIKKDKRYGALHSHILGVEQCADADDEDVIVHLDGDDWFAHSGVLQKVYDVYQETGCWVTYGTYQPTDPQFPMICRQFDPSRSFVNQVEQQWIFSQLRTFKKFLWDRLKSEDFIDSRGQLFTSACDVVIFLPILEMATHKKVKFIDEILYIYNRDNLNDDKWNIADQTRCCWEAVAKLKYDEKKNEGKEDETRFNWKYFRRG